MKMIIGVIYIVKILDNTVEEFKLFDKISNKCLGDF